MNNAYRKRDCLEGKKRGEKHGENGNHWLGDLLPRRSLELLFVLAFPLPRIERVSVPFLLQR
jgi:hypothetical protein